MKLSGWIRLGIAAGALTATACEDPELEALRREHQEMRDRHQALVVKPGEDERDRLVRLETACRVFVDNAGWWNRSPLAEGTPELARDDMAIRQMLEACENSWPAKP